jgi:hypothetical protein
MLFQANELFQIRVDENAVFPLNLIFDFDKNANVTLNQPGIFFMMYKGELIYIGYAIQQEALDRMHRQLETITLRGSSVSFNDLAVSTIRNSKTISPFFTNTMLERRNGFETSQKRILFAENHWQDFAFLDEDILKNFVFNWYPIDCNIPRKCNALKAVLKPRCNQEGLLQGDYVELVEKLNL